MELRRAGYAVAFMILLCVLQIGVSDAKRKITETIYSDGGCPESIDADMVGNSCIKFLVCLCFVLNNEYKSQICRL